MRAWLNLRHSIPERYAAFTAGLKRIGYRIEEGTTQKPSDRDILVTWNRVHVGHTAALAFEQAGLPVLVTENASWGNDFNGQRWLYLARNYHNTAGLFPVGDSSRWDGLGIDLAPWRTGGETVLLPQRGIGPHPVAMPHDWPHNALQKHSGRIRAHPGISKCISLEDDLAHCGHNVTWGSGAAIKALMWGIPVTSYMPDWVGQQGNTGAGRLAMFRRLAWANFTLQEFESGEPFKRMLT